MQKVSWKIKRKGYWLFKNGKVKKEFENEKRIHFSVRGEGVSHSVIYDKKKNDFSCDCNYFSLKLTDCSHIIACKNFIRDQDAN